MRWTLTSPRSMPGSPRQWRRLPTPRRWRKPCPAWPRTPPKPSWPRRAWTWPRTPPPTTSLPRALIVAGAQARPGREVVGGGERGHVHARLGQDGLGGARGHAGHGLRQRRGVGKRRHGLGDPGIERGDVSVQRIDQRQVLLKQERVVGGQPAHECLPEGGLLLAEQALRARGELVGVVDAHAQGLQDRAAGVAPEDGDETAELDVGQLQRLRDAVDMVAAFPDERLTQTG